MCVLTEPRVFDQDEHEGVVRLLDERPPHSLHPAVREAAAQCPASVIWLEEHD